MESSPVADILENPPIHLGLSDQQRRRLHDLRRRDERSLTPDEDTELRILHHMEEDERFGKAPMWGPGGASFKFRALRPRQGRPPGGRAEVLSEVVRATVSWPGQRPPTQAWVAYQLNYGGDPHDKDGAKQVRRILRRVGFPTWVGFIDSLRETYRRHNFWPPDE
jgi:hypothetical protein